MVADKTVVLIVEDDQNIVDLVRSNLSARGHDVIVSKDGTGVSEALQARGLDVVLLDLMLPERDGFELCREIREQSGVGIIVLSIGVILAVLGAMGCVVGGRRHYC